MSSSLTLVRCTSRCQGDIRNRTTYRAWMAIREEALLWELPHEQARLGLGAKMGCVGATSAPPAISAISSDRPSLMKRPGCSSSGVMMAWFLPSLYSP
jgi:hypothetical protein